MQYENSKFSYDKMTIFPGKDRFTLIAEFCHFVML